MDNCEKMASGNFEDDAEGTVSIKEYIESMDAEELVIILFQISKLYMFLILTQSLSLCAISLTDS